MPQRITKKGLIENLGRQCSTDFQGRRHNGILFYSTYHEAVVLRGERGTKDIPLRHNSNIVINQQRYIPGKRIWRTYEVSLE